MSSCGMKECSCRSMDLHPTTQMQTVKVSLVLWYEHQSATNEHALCPPAVCKIEKRLLFALKGIVYRLAGTAGNGIAERDVTKLHFSAYKNVY